MTDNSIYVLFTELQRQYPRYPVTIAQCAAHAIGRTRSVS